MSFGKKSLEFHKLKNILKADKIQGDNIWSGQ